MSNDETILIEIESEVLAFDMPIQDVVLIEVSNNNLQLEIVDCKILEVELPTKDIIQIDFPAQVIINNTGDPSPSIQAVIEEYEAASQVNINRVVALRPDGRIEHADKDTLNHNLDVIGVSKTSGAMGQLITVVKFGRLTGASFGAVSENFFLGNNGQLTSVAPVSGNWLNIGIQETLNEFFVNIGESILI